MTNYNLNYLTEQVEAAGGNGAEEVCHFAQNDPYGLLMAILGMGVVFLVLLLLYAVFSSTPVLYTTDFKAIIASVFSKKKTALEITEQLTTTTSKPQDMHGEVNAAIAAAIYLYRSELHDYEHTVLTINKVSRTYSPWSSKIYGLRNFPKN